MKSIVSQNIPATKGNVTASPVKFRKSSLPPFDADAQVRMAIGKPLATIELPKTPAVTHSPLPWFINESNRAEIGCTMPYDDDTEDGDIQTVAELDPSLDESEADAAFIVRAVNNHEALLDACKAVLDMLHDRGENFLGEQDILRKAIAAASI